MEFVWTNFIYFLLELITREIFPTLLLKQFHLLFFNFIAEYFFPSLSVQQFHLFSKSALEAISSIFFSSSLQEIDAVTIFSPTPFALPWKTLGRWRWWWSRWIWRRQGWCCWWWWCWCWWWWWSEWEWEQGEWQERITGMSDCLWPPPAVQMLMIKIK